VLVREVGLQPRPGVLPLELKMKVIFKFDKVG